MADVSCLNCGAENQAGRKFCGQCGSSLAITCSHCGAANPAADRFCGECGTPLDSTPSVTATALSTKVAATPPAAERRLVTVLFADLVGFTTLSERRDPEEVRGLLTDYFDRCREIVDRFGGQIDKFIGDAVMAVWGATTSEDDDAERAVRSALDLVDMVAKLGAEIGIADLNARVGIFTGESSVGPGANDIGLIVGDKVNTASRLQSLAEPGTVLVGEPTYHLTSRSIAYTSIGEHTVKGKDEPVSAFRADRLLSNLGGRGKAETLEAPFVGRDNELRICKDALHSVSRENRARMISVVGQAGIGKSRLVWEFKKYVDGLIDDIYWHQGRSPSYGDGLTMWALGEMVRSRAGISEADDSRVSTMRVSDMLTEYVSDEADAAWIEPHLLALLGLGSSVGERSEMFAAFRLFFEHIARRGTVVLVFEDLHWADAGLLDFVQEFVDWSRDHPVLVINLTRPDLLERRPTWGAGRRGLVSIHLDPLAASDMEALINGLVIDLPQQARGKMLEHAGGIPMYAIEMVRMLIAQGDLEEVGEGRFRPVGLLDQIAIPDSVSAVIGARLDRLDPADRALVQEASILGQSFSLEGLTSLHEATSAELESRLNELVRREILELVRDPRSPERGQYRFVQSLIREISHGRLGRATRRTGHLRAADFYAAQGDPELAGIVATHLLEAMETTDDADEAAALRSRVASALGEAVERSWSLHSYEQVVSLVEEASALLDDASLLAPLWELAALAATAVLDPDRAEGFARKLFEYHEQSGDLAGMHAATALRGEVLNSANRIDQAIELLKPYVDQYGQNDEHDLELAAARGELARSYMLSGDLKQAAGEARQALIAAELLGDEKVAAQAMITRGTSLSNLHRPRESSALLKGGLEIARTHSLTRVVLRALANLGYAATSLADAVRYTNDGLEEARRVGDRSMVLFFLGNRASYRAFAGQYEEFDRLVEEDSALDPEGDVSRMGTYQAWAMTAQGRLEEAREVLAAAEMAIKGDPQAADSFKRSLHYLTMIQGDLAPAFEEEVAYFEDTGGRRWIDIYTAALCAALSRSGTHIDFITGKLESIGDGSEATDLLRREIGAYRAASAGAADEALDDILRLAERWEGGELPLERARVLGMFAAYLPDDHPNREPLLEQACAETEALGAHGWTRLLKEAAAGALLGKLDRVPTT